MNELILKVNQNPGSIELNFDDIERAIDERVAEYDGALFTDETMDIAKGERASLRKVKKDLDDARKNVKKEWMRPYDEFEVRIKQLLGKIDKPIDLIDDQVKAFEEKKRAEKREKISELYSELMGYLIDYIPIEKVYDSKWENVSTTMKSIKEDIQTFAEDAQTSVDTIKSMNSEKEAEALSVYWETLNMSKAISVITNYEKQKAEILAREEERRKKEEEARLQMEIERARAAERERLAELEKVRAEERAKAEEAISKAPACPDMEPADIDDDDLPFEQPTTITAFYRVVATPEELTQVEMAFNSIGIYFERKDS